MIRNQKFSAILRKTKVNFSVKLKKWRCLWIQTGGYLKRHLGKHHSFKRVVETDEVKNSQTIASNALYVGLNKKCSQTFSTVIKKICVHD